MTTVGVLALQGAFIEHEQKLQQLGVKTVQVRLPHHLTEIDALIIPGGESTTIGKLATSYELIEPLKYFAQTKPTWGTCAGMIFLASRLEQHHQPILGVMDITVDRNAFGRQVDSFETDLAISGLDEPFHAVFIRAPIATAVGEKVEVLAQLSPTQIVIAREGHLLASAFHPELTDDARLHQYFLDMLSD